MPARKPQPTSQRSIGATHGLLYPLDAVYQRAGIHVPRVRRVPPTSIPTTYRSLLDHEDDMTLKLEERHDARLILRRLSGFTRGKSYFRRVLLVQERSGRPVEMGAIRMRVDAFPAAIRRRILENRVPLGRILYEAGWEHRSRPTSFLAITPNGDMMGAFWMREASTLYGRRTEIFHQGSKIGDIVEVLPLA